MAAGSRPSRLETSATDNGNGGTTTANTTLTAEELEAALGFPLEELLTSS